MNNIVNLREQELLKEIRLAGGACRIGFLAEQLRVSDETVRRNIKVLESRSLVRKVHGGVQLIVDNAERPYSDRLDKNAQRKQLLGAMVAKMVSNGDSLFLDVGSTTAYVAQALLDHQELFVVTNSMLVAHTLAMRNNNRVFVPAGEVRAHDGGVFGVEAAAYLERFNVQFAVLSVAAINDTGFMLHDAEEAAISRQMLGKAVTGIAIADSDKFDRRAPISIGDPDKFSFLVADADPGDSVRNMLDSNKVQLVLPST
jgi:DeoR family glycerol-3-phosphate regulon repressor